MHPSQAKGVLAYLGIEHALRSDMLSCAECGGALTRETLAAARKGEQGVVLCCQRLRCQEMFHDR